MVISHQNTKRLASLKLKIKNNNNKGVGFSGVYGHQGRVNQIIKYNKIKLTGAVDD